MQFRFKVSLQKSFGGRGMAAVKNKSVGKQRAEDVV
jgi:hypothetical protein